MKLSPITTEIHERQHRFELTEHQMRAALISSALHSLGLEFTDNVSAQSEFCEAGGWITIIERIAAAEPISSAQVTTPKPTPALEIEPISSPEGTTSFSAEKRDIPPSSSPPAFIGGRAPQWTAAEDDQIIAICIANEAATRRHRVIEAEKVLPGRTQIAIEFRMKTVLRERIADELHAIGEARANTAAHSAPEVVRTPDPEKAPEAISAPAPAQDGASAGDIAAHLAALPYPAGWDIAQDVELMERSIDGMKAADIADVMGWNTGFITMRFNALVGRRHMMPPRYTRDEALAGLRALATDTVAVTREGEA